MRCASRGAAGRRADVAQGFAGRQAPQRGPEVECRHHRDCDARGLGVAPQQLERGRAVRERHAARTEARGDEAGQAEARAQLEHTAARELRYSDAADEVRRERARGVPRVAAAAARGARLLN